MTLYRMLDDPTASKAAIPVADLDEADHWNGPEHRYGIFATINAFAGQRRKENLQRIRAWAVDIDEGTKDEQRKRLESSPLVPSTIVETKRGFQAHWRAKDGVADHWNALVLERLVPFFGADKNARDLCRILRVPGFMHWKDPADPFLIRRVWSQDVAYTERQMADAFPWTPDMAEHQRGVDEVRAQAERAEVRKRREAERARDIAEGRTPVESVWDEIRKLDQRDALERLSGTQWVNGEQYSFRPASRGHQHIVVDGKGADCWLDADGMIGSKKKGGPTIVEWLKFFGRSHDEVIEALTSAYPHLREIDERWRARRRQA